MCYFRRMLIIRWWTEQEIYKDDGKYNLTHSVLLKFHKTIVGIEWKGITYHIGPQCNIVQQQVKQYNIRIWRVSLAKGRAKWRFIVGLLDQTHQYTDNYACARNIEYKELFYQISCKVYLVVCDYANNNRKVLVPTLTFYLQLCWNICCFTTYSFVVYSSLFILYNLITQRF